MVAVHTKCLPKENTASIKYLECFQVLGQNCKDSLSCTIIFFSLAKTYSHVNYTATDLTSKSPHTLLPMIVAPTTKHSPKATSSELLIPRYQWSSSNVHVASNIHLSDLLHSQNQIKLTHSTYLTFFMYATTYFLLFLKWLTLFCIHKYLFYSY